MVHKRHSCVLCLVIVEIPDDPSAAPSISLAQADVAVLDGNPLLVLCLPIVGIYSKLFERSRGSLMAEGPMEASGEGLITFSLLGGVKDSQDANKCLQGNYNTSYFSTLKTFTEFLW